MYLTNAFSAEIFDSLGDNLQVCASLMCGEIYTNGEKQSVFFF